MSAISDSSPLILYSAAGRLNLLQAVYREIVVPPAVWREVVVEGAGRAGAHEIEAARWIVRSELPVPRDQRLSLQPLDPGEAEAIALAFSAPRTVPVLPNDLRAREVAEGIGLRVTGSVGVLLLAKRVGIIPLVRPLLDELRRAGLYISDAAINRTQTLAGEP
jgi:predicted nucleic acid-binding protein